MTKVDGNIYATVQVKTLTKNEIGENEATWEDYTTLYGWLDLSNGDSKYTTFNAKLQESTHIFICDYVTTDYTPNNARMIVNNEVYEILLIDNPMGMNEHLEIYLKYVGGGIGVS